MSAQGVPEHRQRTGHHHGFHEPGVDASRYALEDGAFGTAFYVVHTIELMSGATNLTLMGLNARDGLRMAGRLRSRLSA